MKGENVTRPDSEDGERKRERKRVSVDLTLGHVILASGAKETAYTRNGKDAQRLQRVTADCNEIHWDCNEIHCRLVYGPGQLNIGFLVPRKSM